MPPTLIRRPLTVSVWLLISIVCVVLSPLLLGVGAAASALTGRPQPLILARLLAAYFARELAGLLACGALWLLSGAGRLMRTPRFQLLHWRLLRWFVHGIAGRALDLLDVDVASDSAPEATSALSSDRPLIMLSRHAGPGDTILLVDQLLSHFGRRPSVVFKDTLTLEPFIDLVAHRLPHAVLDTEDREECEAQIEAIAGGLDRRGVLLLFPEGGNFTQERRRRALASLRGSGRRREAARAEEMPHVLPPHPTGVQAALRGNADADVIFAAHTGLGLAAFPRELWREMPIGRTLHTQMWLVPASELPSDSEQQVGWLYDWWKRIDQWVDQQHREQ